MIERLWVPGKGFFFKTDNIEELYKVKKLKKGDFENEHFKLRLGNTYDFFGFFNRPVKFLGYLDYDRSVELYFLVAEDQNLFGKQYWIFEMVVIFYEVKTSLGPSNFQVLLFNTKNGGSEVPFVDGKGWKLGSKLVRKIV